MSHISPTTAELLTVEHVLPEQLTGRPKLRPMQMLALDIIRDAWRDLHGQVRPEIRADAIRFLTDTSDDGPLAHWCGLLPMVSKEAIIEAARKSHSYTRTMLGCDRV